MLRILIFPLKSKYFATLMIFGKFLKINFCKIRSTSNINLFVDFLVSKVYLCNKNPTVVWFETSNLLGDTICSTLLYCNL